MAKVVLVHGAFNELWGPNEIKARWLPALRDGLWHHGVSIEDNDVAVCFYGDLFRRHPGTEAEKRLERSRAGVADALATMAGGADIADLGQIASDASFERTVDMITVMTTDPNLESAIAHRIGSVVNERTQVVVAHSLGSVLSYAALCHHTDWNVDTFVTLGSPLGQDMIFNSLKPAPVDGVGVWPRSVKHWVNVRARGDKAAEVSLVERFGPRVEEVLIDNGHRAHDPEPYMNAAATGAAVAEALSP